MELSVLYPTLVFIAIVLLGLSLYFSKRTTPKHKVNKQIVDQILGVHAKPHHVNEHDVKYELNEFKESHAHSATKKDEKEEKEVRINPLTQMPILTKSKNASSDKSYKFSTSTGAQVDSLKSPTVSEGGWNSVTIFENTPERLAGVKVLITLIREDSDGKLRASLSYYDKTGTENEFRVSTGDLVNINTHPCKVEKISFVENNRGNVKFKVKTPERK